MKNIKMYEADDKMINLIRDDYSLLHMLGAFGIKLGYVEQGDCRPSLHFHQYGHNPSSQYCAQVTDSFSCWSHNLCDC